MPKAVLRVASTAAKRADLKVACWVETKVAWKAERKAVLTVV